MQRGGEGRRDVSAFGDPFSMFRGFGMPSLFGGADPFDDPFFSRPFGSMFDSNSHRSHRVQRSTSGDASQRNGEKAIVIEEMGSDDEMDESLDTGHEPTVEHPDDELDEKRNENVDKKNDYFRMNRTEPQTRTFSSHSCKVTYGGVDGAYYTSSRTRSTGSDGVVIEENEEADMSTGQARHRISRGIHDKGHSITRKLCSDGKVDTTQTLHNLEEDELTGFEEAWKGNVKDKMPGWSDQFGTQRNTGSSSGNQRGMSAWGGWALPSIERAAANTGNGSSEARAKKVVRINIE